MKVLILGSGLVQMEAVEYLMLQQVEVHVLSNLKPAGYASEEFNFKLIDIRDTKKVLDYCRSNHIDQVYSVGSDFGLCTSSFVSEQLGIKHFVPFETAQLLQNKKLFREFANNTGVSHVRFKTGTELAQFGDWDHFPCFLKPTDSQGQRGISFVNNRLEFQRAFDKAKACSGLNEVIAEEFIPGDEISVNVFIHDGEIEDFFITDRIVANKYTGIPKKHVIPSQIPSHLKKQVLLICQNMVSKTGIKNGPMYFQMKYYHHTVKIIEAAARLDGCHLWRLIEMYSRVNILQKSLNKITGTEGSLKNLKPTKAKKMCIEFSLQPPGEKYYDEHISSVFRIPYYQKGEIIRPVNGIMEKTAAHFCIL